jgi:TRAP-type transport system periplasmic protein
MGDTVDALLWDKGFKVVGWWDNGFRHISNNKRPIRVAEDIKGLKLL